MSPGVLSCVIFALTLGGIVLGALLRTTLPQHHLSKESQDVVRLGVGLIATIAALVLGLLIAAAKGSFDTQSGQVKQITADIILLDALLEQYGPEALPIRVEMRSAIGPLADRLWHEKPAAAAGPFAMDAKAESVYIAIQALSPKNDLQRSLQSRAAQISTDLAQTRLLLFVESDSAIPAPFIAILAFWLEATARLSPSWHSGYHHFRELQPVRGAERDGVQLPVAVCAVGVMRDLFDPGAEPAVHRLADDSERAAAQRPRAARLGTKHFNCARDTSARRRGGAARPSASTRSR